MPYTRKRKFGKYMGGSYMPLPRLMPQSAALGGGGPFVSARRNYSYVPRTTGALTGTPERKYFDTSMDNGVVGGNADWTATEMTPDGTGSFVSMVQGTGIANRVGRKICVKKFQIRGCLISAALSDQADAPSLSPIIRMILAVDKQANGTIVQGETVMTDGGSSNGNCFSYQNTDNFGRFTFLKDVTYVLQQSNSFNDNAVAGPASTGSVGFTTKLFKFTYKPRKPFYIHFNATNGGTSADIVDNALFLLAHVSAASPVVNMRYNARLTYTDV